MNRRDLLEELVKAAIAAGLLSPWSLISAQPQNACEEVPPDTPASLKRQLQRLAARDDSEQSTSMYLALENLSGSSGSVAYVPDKLNQALLQKFEHYVDLLLQFKSEPEEGDAVALIELMAAEELLPREAGSIP